MIKSCPPHLKGEILSPGVSSSKLRVQSPSPPHEVHTLLQNMERKHSQTSRHFCLVHTGPLLGRKEAAPAAPTLKGQLLGFQGHLAQVRKREDLCHSTSGMRRRTFCAKSPRFLCSQETLRRKPCQAGGRGRAAGLWSPAEMPARRATGAADGLAGTGELVGHNLSLQ